VDNALIAFILIISAVGWGIARMVLHALGGFAGG
jgi:hypothetical protein